MSNEVQVKLEVGMKVWHCFQNGELRYWVRGKVIGLAPDNRFLVRNGFGVYDAPTSDLVYRESKRWWQR